MKDPLPIVLDTDIGNDPDDLLALAMILDHPDIYDLRGIVTTSKEPELRAEFARCLCAVARREHVPVGVGCASDLSDPPNKFHRDYFARYGLGSKSASDFLSWDDVLSSVTHNITLVTIGPLTTLASFLHAHPGASKSLGMVVSMGGFVSRRNRKPVGEFNFGVDVDATRFVCGFQFPHVCVTKNVCHGVRMCEADIVRLSSSGNIARRWAFDFMKEWFKERESKILYDPLTLAMAVRPECMILQPVEFVISDHHPIARISAVILEQGDRLATVGGAPTDLQWFDEIFYG